eukprot:2215040-Amphidinium_carterae.1
MENRTQLVERVVSGAISSRPVLTEQAWSFLSCKNKQDCETETEQLAAKGLHQNLQLKKQLGEDGADETHAITKEDLHDDD